MATPTGSTERRRGDTIYAADLQSPMFIHPSDNSGLVLSTIQLTGDNCRHWRRSMLKALSVKNKVWILDGSTGRTDENLMQWYRCNDIVCSWILNTVSKEIYNSIDEYETAHEMWKDLEESYGQKNGPLIYQIKKRSKSLTVSKEIQCLLSISRSLRAIGFAGDGFPLEMVTCANLSQT